MALTFDTGKHARAIREGGVPEPAADAIVDAITEATDSLVTEEFLRKEMANQTERLQSEMALQTERLQNEMASGMDRAAAARGMWRDMYLLAGTVTGVSIAIAGIALATEMATMRAEMWRAMYLLAGTVTGVSIAIAGIALAIAELF